MPQRAVEGPQENLYGIQIGQSFIGPQLSNIQTGGNLLQMTAPVNKMTEAICKHNNTKWVTHQTCQVDTFTHVNEHHRL